MADVNWELIIFIIIAGLIIFAGMGIFIGTRISSDKRRIRELEEELSETRKDLEDYRSKVNTHFKKTSELFTQMTSSYKAVYMHLAEGSQELCTADAALLKPANVEFLKVTHEEKKLTEEKPVAEHISEKPHPAPEDKPGQTETGPADIQQQQKRAEPQQKAQAPAEEEKQEEKTAESAKTSVGAEEIKGL